MRRCHLSAQRLEIVYAMGQLGVGCALVPGAIYDHAGPALTAIYAFILTAGANIGLQRLVQFDGCGGVVQLALLYMAMQNGSVALYQAGLFSNIRSAQPGWQGTVAGIVAAGYGLSAAFWSTCFEQVFAHRLRVYFLATAIVFSSTGLFAAVSLGRLMRPCGHKSQTYGRLHDDFAGTAVAVGKPQPQSHDDVQESVVSCAAVEKQVDVPKCALGQILRCSEFWVFVVTFATVQAVGSGIFIANLALMGGSLGMSEGRRAKLVVMVSYCNCGGRILAGFLLDFGEARGLPRAAQAIWTAGCMALVVGILCFMPEASVAWLLIPSFAVVGIAYGANWAIMPSFMAARFGNENCGCCFNIAASVMSLTVLLTSYSVGILYDAILAQQTSAEGAAAEKDGVFELCKGMNCWRWAYLLGLGLSIIGLVAACWGAHRALAQLHEAEAQVGSSNASCH